MFTELLTITEKYGALTKKLDSVNGVGGGGEEREMGLVEGGGKASQSSVS